MSTKTKRHALAKGEIVASPRRKTIAAKRKTAGRRRKSDVIGAGGRNLLIVFTDEVRSTAKDETELKSVGNDPATIRDYKSELVKRRCAQFGQLAKELLNTTKTSRIVKNIGDALLITLETNDGDPELLKCIEALFRAWDSLKSTVRVAIHLAPIDSVATGEDLDTFVDRLREHSPMLTDDVIEGFWPALEFISIDVFGPPMNRAARLASVPKEFEFVVSQEVISALVADNEGLGPEQRIERGQTRLKNALNAIVDTVPLIHLRGINTVCYKKPWWVLDVRRPDSAPRLIWQFKSVQSIRVIDIKDHCDSPESVAEALALLSASIDDRATGAPFFVDLLFKIEEAWSGHNYSRDRSFRDRDRKEIPFPGFNPRDIVPEASRAIAVVFSGCPDIETDDKLRAKCLAYQSSSGWLLQPKTMRIYRRAWYTCSSPNADLPCVNGYYLVEFQVKAASLIPPDSPDIFAGIERDYPPMGLHPIAYGHVEGERDGFALFRTKTLRNTDVLKRLKISQGPPVDGPKKFLDRVALISVYSLTLEGKNKEDEVWKALCHPAEFPSPKVSVL